jgi:hypothetical protein
MCFLDYLTIRPISFGNKKAENPYCIENYNFKNPLDLQVQLNHLALCSVLTFVS